MKKSIDVTQDSWFPLKELTPARIALGRTGGSLPVHQWLDFKSAHAGARDAVHCVFEVEAVLTSFGKFELKTVVVDTQVSDRMTYLQRPDLGRRLSAKSSVMISGVRGPFDLVIIVSDGLSAMAVHKQAVPVLKLLIPLLQKDAWLIAPIVVARFGRVALQDEIGAEIGARIALILIGERPGLGSPDSLGAYFVFNPRIGNTDGDRNCVSNIRPEGLSHANTADTLFYLLRECRSRRLSGVYLKDERPALGSTHGARLRDVDSR